MPDYEVYIIFVAHLSKFKQMAKKVKKQIKKQIRDEVIASLTKTLAQYKDGMGEKKFNKRLRKSGTTIADRFAKNAKISEKKLSVSQQMN
jgi:hypothetical protein